MTAEEKAYRETEAFVVERFGTNAAAAVILGSGLGGLAVRLSNVEEIPYGEIPGFPGRLVQGHRGILAKGVVEGRTIVAFAGRFHLYQGLSPAQVVCPVRLARAMGARTVILTCCAGAVNARFEEGDLLVVEDQINLTGVDPVGEIPEERREPKFVSMKGAFDRAMVETSAGIAFAMGLACHRGVLAGVRGPCYETPAEIRWLRRIGADAVSMSTIPEAIFARYLGLSTAAIALITNRAADLDGSGPSHGDVLAVARKHHEAFEEILLRVASALPRGGDNA